jgi:glycine reductase
VVKAVSFDAKSGIDGGYLSIDEQSIVRDLRDRDSRLIDVKAHLALPGGQTRILCVKDVIQPRHNLENGGTGSGTVVILDNFAVVTCGPIVGFQEGIIDMSGPGAAYTPFSAMPLLILECEVENGLTAHAHEEVVREAGLRAAEEIASSCSGAEPDSTEDMDWAPLPGQSGLPRIAYVYMVLSQGLLHDTWVLGQNAMTGLPAVLDPRIAFDNGIVSGNCVSACDKNTTYHHQNNPVISALLRGHGSRWDFRGSVVTNAATRLAHKQQSAAAAIEMTIGLGVQGAIISKEGFGNPDADLMMLIRGLERAGIKTVALTDEFAGIDGSSQSLADTTPEADAIISVGNANARIELPAMTTTIGPLPDVSRLAGGYAQSLRPDGSMEVELQAIIGATNELGYGRLSCREL